MAALLDIVHLRPHALPAPFMVGLDRVAYTPARLAADGTSALGRALSQPGLLI